MKKTNRKKKLTRGHRNEMLPPPFHQYHLHQCQLLPSTPRSQAPIVSNLWNIKAEEATTLSLVCMGIWQFDYADSHQHATLPFAMQSYHVFAWTSGHCLHDNTPHLLVSNTCFLNPVMSWVGYQAIVFMVCHTPQLFVSNSCFWTSF